MVYFAYMSSLRKPLPITLALSLFAIAIINASASAYYLYWTLRWLDMPMHFAGGAWLAGFGVWWQFSRREIGSRNFLAVLWVCLIYTISIGLVWEVYEAAISFFTVGYMNAMPDTLGDLLFDILGGTTVAVFTWWRMSQKHN
ncbi:MAG: hypothetical protein UV24_C0006G0003 [Candidatus Nomurabacteria bacterium GW2011_GWA2_42_41]|nr:MAG: hypothetical protein UV24_C0006G0003 [Candidatus Nomurabacteria bacterium GW2011_GWA2_42_41]